MPYVEKRTTGGDILEIKRYYSPKGCGGKRKPKKKASSSKQQRANAIKTEEDLWWVIVTNFDRRNGDQFSTLTFGKDVDEETAEREKRNFIRRLRRWAKKNGNEDFKYVTKIEKQGRWHIHLISNRIPLEALLKLWGRGRVTSSILDDTNNYRDLAAYLSPRAKAAKGDPDKEPEERRKYARSWSGSHNLKRPAVEVREIKRDSILKKPPAAPKGYILLPDWEMGCTGWGNLYQYFKCKRIYNPPKRGKRKKE